jgi:hypothetical protein
MTDEVAEGGERQTDSANPSRRTTVMDYLGLIQTIQTFRTKRIANYEPIKPEEQQFKVTVPEALCYATNIASSLAIGAALHYAERSEMSAYREYAIAGTAMLWVFLKSGATVDATGSHGIGNIELILQSGLICAGAGLATMISQ